MFTVLALKTFLKGHVMALVASLVIVLALGWIGYELHHSGYMEAKTEGDLKYSQREQELLAAKSAADDKAAKATSDAAKQVAAIDKQSTADKNAQEQDFKKQLASYQSGNLQLRKRLAAANTRASNLSKASGSPGVGDGSAQTGLQPADVELLVRAANDADAEALKLKTCQAIVASDRDIMSKYQEK